MTAVAGVALAVKGPPFVDDQAHARRFGRVSHDRSGVGVLLPRLARAAGLGCRRLERVRRRDRRAVGCFLHQPLGRARDARLPLHSSEQPSWLSRQANR